MSYTPIGWKDYPDKTTPVNAENLNHMDEGILNNNEAITELRESVSEQSKSTEKRLKIYTGTLPAGSAMLQVSNSNITEDSILSFYTSIYGVSPTAVSVSNNTLTLTFKTQSVDMKVGVRIDG